MSPAPELGPHYHVGCVVSSLPEVCATLTAATGASWTEVQERTLDARTSRGRESFALRYVYSLDEPYLEIIEALPDSLWNTGQEFVQHHLGFWTTDLAGDHARLLAAGLECVYAGADDHHDGVVRGAYFRGVGGVLIEIVDASLRPAFEQTIRAGRATKGLT